MFCGERHTDSPRRNYTQRHPSPNHKRRRSHRERLYPNLPACLADRRSRSAALPPLPDFATMGCPQEPAAACRARQTQYPARLVECARMLRLVEERVRILARGPMLDAYPRAMRPVRTTTNLRRWALSVSRQYWLSNRNAPTLRRLAPRYRNSGIHRPEFLFRPAEALCDGSLNRI